MKNLNEMNVKELREVAKELNIAGRWDMNKGQLIEAIEKIEAEKEAAKKAETPKAKAMKVQRAFVEVANDRKEIYRYITITIKNVDELKAAEYVDAVCAKMKELDDEFDCEYKALRCPDVEENSYTDMISFEKAAGKIAYQRSYVGKLMTRAIAALK